MPELHTLSPDSAFIQAAREQYQEEGSIEIDENAVVSRGDEDGHYVQAWVWVSARQPTQEEIDVVAAEINQESEE